MGLTVNPSLTSSGHPFCLFLHRLSEQTLNLFFQNRFGSGGAGGVKAKVEKSNCTYVSSRRIGPPGVRDCPLPGDRQRPGLQAAAGRPEGEPARLPGPGGQRPPLPGREEAVLQRRQACARLLGRPGGRPRQLRGPSARLGRPDQTHVAHRSGPQRPAEEGETAEGCSLSFHPSRLA